MWTGFVCDLESRVLSWVVTTPSKTRKLSDFADGGHISHVAQTLVLIRASSEKKKLTGWRQLVWD